ncbi:hypothetical protein AGABI1DRAFT_113206 [Agaricus bisporus var. burnettii JB137-S8]|uniref:Uncharacterized protein n=1 Tax=Agaricus bisporus var. burnettii (strain JB137-S8 / ATCC MYA-4627 / FGSC 10392) TaxID=597362 RepID=K5X9P9_AGABU|nr:uncharacterized protein AGABI1DRAFT_113206 [Agaricus bisporus var. burnettii JB137-S8]EKM79963.1 hypothetical protein AGABI1DRAFT_113206 [Agaricus bisporus var. burnettii JB137-S8]
MDTCVIEAAEPSGTFEKDGLNTQHSTYAIDGPIVRYSSTSTGACMNCGAQTRARRQRHTYG